MYFIKTEIDPNGGNDYSISSLTKLMSVPYALYAKNAAKLEESDPVFFNSIAYGISESDTANWNNNNFTETDPLYSANFEFAEAVEGDLLQFNGTKWVAITPNYLSEYTVTEADVKTHETTLTISESQISDLQTYLTSEQDADETNEIQNLTQVLQVGNNAGNMQIKNIATPTETTDAVNKAYVDSLKQTIEEQRNTLNYLKSVLVKGNLLDETVVWDKLYGGDNIEHGYQIISTQNNTYYIIGATNSSANGDVKNANSIWSSDLWIIEIDKYGNLLQENSFEYSSDLSFVSKGAFINSNQNLVVIGENRGFNSYSERLALYEISPSGILVRDTVYNNLDTKYISSASNFDNEKFYVTGTSPLLGNAEIIMMNNMGDTLWIKTYGGTNNDRFANLIEDGNEGYIAVGYTSSSESGDIKGVNNGKTDMWLVQLNPDFTIKKEILIGGAESEYSYASIIKLQSGEYIATVGSRSSETGTVTDTTGGYDDILVTKLNENLDIVWSNLYGGGASEYPKKTIELSDGSLLIGGYSGSSASGDVKGETNGGTDIWLLHIDAEGTILWESLYGGTGLDILDDMIYVGNNEVIITGRSTSSYSGNVSDKNNGNQDLWILKVQFK